MTDRPAILYPFDQREVLSVSCAAARAQVSNGTIRNWCEQHSIGRKIGGAWKVSKVALQMYLDGNGTALRLYLAGEKTADVVRGYYAAEGIEVRRTVVVDIQAQKEQIQQFV